MKKLLLITLTLISCMAPIVHAQITLIPVSSSFGCVNTGVELQASGGTYYWLYDQDPIPGVLPIDSNETGNFIVYKTGNYLALGEEGGSIGLSQPGVFATVETPPVITTTVNYYPILGYELNAANKFSFTTCGGDANLIIGAEFSANENVTNVDYIWSNYSVGPTNLVSPGAYNCTMVTNNGCSYVSDWVSVTYTEPSKPKIKNIGTDDSPKLSAKVENFAPYDESVQMWYQWYRGNFPIDGNDSIYVPTASGKYSVLVGQGPCTSTSKKVKIVLPSQKEEALTTESITPEISVYPSPATDWVTVEGLTEETVLTDLFGRAVKTVLPSEKIYVGDLPNGIYLILKQKVVVQH